MLYEYVNTGHWGRVLVCEGEVISNSGNRLYGSAYDLSVSELFLCKYLPSEGTKHKIYATGK